MYIACQNAKAQILISFEIRQREETHSFNHFPSFFHIPHEVDLQLAESARILSLLTPITGTIFDNSL